MTQTHDVVIVGGGQAGLAMSYQLKQSDIEHVALEAARVGEAWRTHRWDSFCLVTPNWTVSLPGAPYEGNDPDGFMPRDDVIQYLERYQKRFDLPVRTGVRVTSVERDGEGYALATSAGALRARNVVVAAGAFPAPHLPVGAERVPKTIRQIHTEAFRNARDLPEGAVLVVGSGQSGGQIAEELVDAGRRVFVCVGSCPRAPRRYRGRDLLWWLFRTGFVEKRVQDLPTPQARFACKPLVSGQRGGHEIDLRALAARGATLLGRWEGVEAGIVRIKPGLNESLARSDAFARTLLKDLDAFAAAHGLDLPQDPAAHDRFATPPDKIPEPSLLDLEKEGIRTIVWGTGYRPEFPWIRVPVFDAEAHPIHRRGVTQSPGLYFLGLAWLHRHRSDTLFGVGDDAEFIAGHIAGRLPKPMPG